MSIESLIYRFGRTFYVYRPTVAAKSDGTSSWSYLPKDPTLTLQGFLQPSAQSEDPFEGRANTRTTGTMYFVGDQDIRIEDEIYTTTNGTSPCWRVRGRINAGELGKTFAAPHLNMTAVDVIEVSPTLTVTVPS